MSNLQYDNFPKFIVSLGIIIIAIPFLIILFFLQENSVLLVTESELALLSEISQNTMYIKQKICLWIAEHIIFIFCFCEGLGLALFVLGCKMWYTLQRKLNKKQDLDYETAKKQLEKMSDNEQEQKIDLEINEISISATSENIGGFTENLSLEEIKEKQEQVRQQNRIIHEAIRKRYKIVEFEITKMIKNQMSNNYEIQDNMKIGYSAYDVVCINKNGDTDYIFEIKYIIDSMYYSYSRMMACRANLEKSASIYKEETGRKVKLGLIVVSPDAEKSKIENLFNRHINNTVDLYYVTEKSEWFGNI